MPENKVHAKVHLNSSPRINMRGYEEIPISLRTHVNGVQFTAKTHFVEKPSDNRFLDDKEVRKTKILAYLKGLANSVEIVTVEIVTID